MHLDVRHKVLKCFDMVYGVFARKTMKGVLSYYKEIFGFQFKGFSLNCWWTDHIPVSV